MNHAERKALKRAEAKKPTYTMTADELTAMRKNIQDDANRQVKEIEARIKRDAEEEANNQIREICEGFKRDITNQALEMLFSIPVLVLHDKFGFGDQRLDRFLKAVQTWVKAINADPETLAEIVQTAKDEIGYEFMRCDNDDEGTTP